MNQIVEEHLALSEKEANLLYEMSLNARASVAQVAAGLGMSRQAASYTLESLEKKQVLEATYAVLNINRLGFLYHRIFFKFRNVDIAKENEIIAYCSKHKKIGWVIQHQGDWDFAVIVWAHNALELQEVLDDILEKYGVLIDEKFISVSTSIHHLKHRILTGEQSDEELLMGGPAQGDEVDELDYDIMGLLTKSARLPVSEIAEKLSQQPNHIKNRIEKLQNEKIILGYHIKLNHRLLGFTHLKVFLQLTHHNQGDIEKLIGYIKRLSGSIYITRAIGLADLEFELYVANHEEFHEIMRQLRVEFAELLKSYSSVVIRYEPYINYLPIKK